MIAFLTRELIHGVRRTPPGYPVAVCAAHVIAALAMLGLGDGGWRGLVELFAGV